MHDFAGRHLDPGFRHRSQDLPLRRTKAASVSDETVETIRREAEPFEPTPEGVQPLVEAVAGASLVLIGEATHGTHEFYAARAELTRRLVAEHGFNVIALEADWPDAYRINRFVRHGADDAQAGAGDTAPAALDDFTRFPRWMWRNQDVLAFVRWLGGHNRGRPPGDRTGVYGLDLYSLHRSIDAVLAYLRKVDPAAARQARDRYACFEDFGHDPQAYGYASSVGLSPACEDEVTAQLVELRRRAMDYASRDGRIAADEYFFAEQNARLVASAETYYRAMFAGRSESWNLRDRHMHETLEALLAHVRQTSGRARAVVWAHNSHLGDARATQMGRGGELNLGQLVRERHGGDAWLVGFTTHTGTVTAARNWDDPAEKRQVTPSLPGSYERLFHDTGLERFWLRQRDRPARDVLLPERLERAIGVIYRPETERVSHYFRASLAAQFDAVIHIDRTSALEPLDPWAAEGAAVDLPETFPSGV
jgi:erythromycin esterase-like protein